MGASCSKCGVLEPVDPATTRSSRQDSPDPAIYDLMRRSVALSSSNVSENPGQHHLLFKQQKKEKTPGAGEKTETHLPPTRLLVRRHTPRHYEEGLSGTHIYAVRYPTDQPMLVQKEMAQEQAQPKSKRRVVREEYEIPEIKDGEPVDTLFRPSAMALRPKQTVVDWVTVSEEHNIYIADCGLTPSQCDQIVQVTEQVCRGQYAAYTYAKQTLGCREFPSLAAVSQPAVHRVTHAILEFSQNHRLALDDREPHMVKYDVTKKERQKLDMHTDKSEWTFLIALSNGCGMDYEGGGTYFEALDATVHLSRGHALIFPGKLRHCGQRITTGLRFLLVGFLVDKTGMVKQVEKEDQTNNFQSNVP